MQGSLVVSLDMELMWGVRHGRTKETYGHRVLGERQAIPAMLDAFADHGIHATWATVGFLMCEGKEDLLTRAPEDRPTYADPLCSSYLYLDEVGENEKSDPYYFAPSLMRRIASCPGQEIATHTFSHYYCLEPGQTPEQFRADLSAAMRIVEDFGSECRSVVFPRNQYSREYLDVCASSGLKAFRGNEDSWCYRPGNGADQTPLRRLTRLADSVFPLTGHHAVDPVDVNGMVNVPSSRFLRPYIRALEPLDGLRLKRVKDAMTTAARDGKVFHLWWHPHNFGADLSKNMAFLQSILGHYRELADTYGMMSTGMTEAAA